MSDKIIKLHFTGSLFPSSNTNFEILSEFIKKIFDGKEPGLNNIDSFLFYTFRFIYLMEMFPPNKLRRQIIEDIGLTYNLFGTGTNPSWIPDIYKTGPLNNIEKFAFSETISALKHIAELMYFSHVRKIGDKKTISSAISNFYPNFVSEKITDDYKKSRSLFQFFIMWSMSLNLNLDESRTRYKEEESGSEEIHETIRLFKHSNEVNVNFNLNLMLDNLISHLKSFEKEKKWFRPIPFVEEEVSKHMSKIETGFTKSTYICLYNILLETRPPSNMAIRLNINNENNNKLEKYADQMKVNEHSLLEHWKQQGENLETNPLILKLLQETFKNVTQDVLSYGSEVLNILKKITQKEKIDRKLFVDEDGFSAKTLVNFSVDPYIAPKKFKYDELMNILNEIYQKGQFKILETSTKLSKYMKDRSEVKPTMFRSDSEKILYIVDFANLLVKMIPLPKETVIYEKTLMYKMFSAISKDKKLSFIQTSSDFTKFDYRLFLFYVQMHMARIFSDEIILNIINCFDLGKWIVSGGNSPTYITFKLTHEEI